MHGAMQLDTFRKLGPGDCGNVAETFFDKAKQAHQGIFVMDIKEERHHRHLSGLCHNVKENAVYHKAHLTVTMWCKV
jgi:hypothetical protein